MSRGYKKFCNICLIFSFTELTFHFPFPFHITAPPKMFCQKINSGYLFLPERTVYISDFRIFLMALQIYLSFFIYSQNIHQVNKWYCMTSTYASEKKQVEVLRIGHIVDIVMACRVFFRKKSRVTDNFKFFSLSNWKDGFSVN